MVAVRLLWIALLAAIVSARAMAADSNGSADRLRSWFKPKLVANHSELCASFLDQSRALFYSTDPLEQLPENFSLPQLENTSFSARFMEVSTHGRTVYLVNRTLGGCGGACERRELHAITDVPPTDQAQRDSWREFMYKLTNAPPPARDYLLLRSVDTEYFVATVVDGKVQLHRLNADLRWTLACAVEVAPQDLRAVDQPSVRRTLKAIVDLEHATESVRGEAGDCGSLASHGRYGLYMSQALRAAIYRPWVLGAGVLEGPPVEPSGLDQALQQWALRGRAEFAAYTDFRAQRARTIREVADFFRGEFGWSDQHSRNAAGHAIDAALDVGFLFSSDFSPFPASEAPLRRALLEHHPIDDIRQLDVPTDEPAKDSYESQFHESVLAVAIDYPQALAWLLEQGQDVDRANAFGKTPLMHAAQRNNLEAVRLLLDRGADPNAATVQPEDNCFYTLSRANVTALHYAVRYGSRELIELLVARGARPFIGSSLIGDLPTKLSPPRDWLETYAGRDAVERNANLTESDVVALRELLRVPPTDELRKIAAELVASAESAYAAGKADAAYRLLKQALYADPASERALTAMSLVAQRAHKQGEALVAATTLISRTTDNKSLAQAWFNLGLACESAGSRYVHYNGNHYCQSSLLYPFLKAWLAEPVTARARKLESVFNAPDMRLCRTSSGTASYNYLLTYGDDRSQRRPQTDGLVYVLHSPEAPASDIDITWRDSLHPDGYRPTLVATHAVGHFQLSLLQAESRPPNQVRVNGLACECDQQGCSVASSRERLMKRLEEAIRR